MLSASFWLLVFFVVLVFAMTMRARMKDNIKLRAWYDRVVKDRLDLVKKIVFIGTLIIWIGIWLATRGDDKASFGSLMREISNSWTQQEDQTLPTPEQ